MPLADNEETPEEVSKKKELQGLAALEYAALTVISHKEPDYHLIGDSIAPPSIINPISTSAGSLGSSTIPAREDHTHLYSAPTVDPGLFQARLTGTTAVPITSADVSAAGTIYLTPYQGNKVSLYDGATWVLFTLTEISLALTATSASMYDVFLYSNAGVLTLEILIWTNTTTRATALVVQDGVLVKSGATTRRYIGSFYASATNKTDDSEVKRFLWNNYNRVARSFYKGISNASWVYNGGYRQLAGDAANQLECCIGVAEDVTTARVNLALTYIAANGVFSIGLDSTTTVAANANQSGMVTYYGTHAISFTQILPIGYHKICGIESSYSSGNITVYGTDSAGRKPTMDGTVFA